MLSLIGEKTTSTWQMRLMSYVTIVKPFLQFIGFIRKNKFCTLEYGDKLVRKIIKNFTVYDDYFVISFKSGIEMEIRKMDVNNP